MAYIGNSPANTGNYQIVDDISSSFNGSLTSFALTAGSVAITPAKSGQLLVGVNGVMQEPDDTGTDGFKVSSSNIVFSSAPASGDTFWAVYQGQAVDIGTPSDDVVDTAHIKDNAITTAKIAAGTIIASDVADGSITNVKMADDAIDSAEIADGAIDLVHMSSDSVDEDNLKVSNSPTNGYALTAQSGNTGGLTWAEMSSTTAINDLTDGTTSATSNIGLGANAVDSITTGDYNVGLGDNAGTAITSGSYNTGVG